ncbi:capsule assembly Wzi family protein [Chloroherpeton thalassium]|uniref:capsule assembly Wzi family protein n=1 Tax=Chloroherpeton thalassium TaxID=100716 RepID=UPI00145F7DB3|nr:capsule assembly Wzi family protein [Chloroherpeton thalassium]
MYVLFLNVANSCYAQKFQYDVEVQSLLATDVPFWLLMNQSGRYNTEDFQPYGNFKIASEFPLSNKLSLKTGAEILAGKTDTYHEVHRFQQAYLELESPYMRLLGGKKEQEKSKIAQLKSGDMVMSSNAAPIPVVQVCTNDYVPFPIISEHLKFKALLAHGWFEEQRHISNPYLHEKYLYLKLENTLPIDGYIGLHHAAMWGGEHPVYGQLPESWSVFKDIFLAKSGEEDTSPEAEEQHNRVGNHIGSYDFGVIYQTDRYTATVYRQTIFEDASGKGIQFIGDGLWGIEFCLKKQNALVEGIVLEFVKTTYQGGPVHDLETEDRLFGNDNYYNNFMYQSGWSYNGFTIGNPFITSPILNLYNSLTTKDGETIVHVFPNNRVLAWHLGIMGQLQNDLAYRLLLSYSLNYGIYDGNYSDAEAKEYTKNGKTYTYYELPDLTLFSSMLELEFPATLFDVSFQAKARVAMDLGNFIGDRFGVLFSLSKSGLF